MNNRKVMMRCIFFFVILYLCSFVDLLGQKEYKPLHNYIKNGGAITSILPTIQNLEKDDDFKDAPSLYYHAALCYRKANDVENTKVYLKQAYDTVSFFNTTYGMFDYVLKCDEKDRLPGKNGKVKLKYRSKGYDLVINKYLNLYNAGIFFTRKKDYANAAKFWSMYLDAADQPLFAKADLKNTDNKMPRAAFWYMSCCYELKDYKNVFKYSDVAIKDSANSDLYYQYRAVSYAQLKDSLNYEKELKEGMEKEPYDMFFFTNLMDYYNKTYQFNKSLALADSILSLNPYKNIVKFAKSVVLYNMKNYDDCITLSKDILAVDSTNVDCWFYVGGSYFNKAVEIDDNIKPNINAKNYSTNKQKARDLFKEALPYMEKYMKLRPEDKNRWAPLLYRIYLSLNMGKKFSEIDALLSKQAETPKK